MLATDTGVLLKLDNCSHWKKKTVYHTSYLVALYFQVKTITPAKYEVFH